MVDDGHNWIIAAHVFVLLLPLEMLPVLISIQTELQHIDLLFCLPILNTVKKGFLTLPEFITACQTLILL